MAIARDDAAAGEKRSIGERVALWRRRHREAVEAWLILTPILFYYSFFYLFPVASNLFISFTRWTGTFVMPEWVGLANYRAWFNRHYPLTMFNTAMFAVVILLIQTSVGLGIATLLNQKVLGRGLFRTLWYVPTLTSAAIFSQLTFVFISPYDGILNEILKAMGRSPVIWLREPFWMRTFIILFSVWRGVGNPVVLFLSAMGGIHPMLYEAARIDGASGWQLFRNITIPLLRPMITFVLITGIIGGFQIFETVMLISAGGQTTGMAGGGPNYTTNVMMLQIFRDAFSNNRMGMASAGAVLLGVLLSGFSIMYLRYMQRGME